MIHAATVSVAGGIEYRISGVNSSTKMIHLDNNIAKKHPMKVADVCDMNCEMIAFYCSI